MILLSFDKNVITKRVSLYILTKKFHYDTHIKLVSFRFNIPPQRFLIFFVHNQFIFVKVNIVDESRKYLYLITSRCYGNKITIHNGTSSINEGHYEMQSIASLNLIEQ